MKLLVSSLVLSLACASAWAVKPAAEATHKHDNKCGHVAVNEAGHMHKDQCGHKKVAHDSHFDYIHDGHYHSTHADHSDDHGQSI